MSDKLKLARMIQVSGVLALSISTPAFAAESVKINDLMIAASIPDAQRDATMKAVQAFYDFWNTGDDRSHAAAGPPARASRTGLRFAPFPHCCARSQGHGGEDDRYRRLCHRAHALHRSLHRQVRTDARQRPAGPLHRDRSRQDRERSHHRQLAHRGLSDAAARNGRRQGRLVGTVQEAAKCCLRERTES